MKKALALALLLSVTPLPAVAADAEFDPGEKISVDLKDAKISDLVTTLGALANLPVYIDPDVSGTITIQLVDVPFAKVLALLNVKTGVFVRIENGKLVASRSAESLFATATLPEAFRGSARIALADFEKARSTTAPVYALVRSNDEETCFKVPFVSGEPPTYSLQIAKSDDVPRVLVTQFAYEPVAKARYFVLEYGDKASNLLFVSGKSTLVEYPDVPGGFRLRLSEEPREGCRDAVSMAPPRTGASMLHFEVRAVKADGTQEVVMAPRLQFLPGQVFGMRSEIQDERTGQHRQMVIWGYVTRDGRSVGAVLTATAIWIDPRDGREYYFAQADSPSIRVNPFPLAPEGVSVGKLSSGVATPRPLELWLFGESSKEGAGEPAPAPRRNEATERP
jgi:hypothetical protein